MSIVLKGITKYFGDHLVVNRVSTTIEDGELFVLLGGSGSGKSTILRLIAGLISPDFGTIELNGKDATKLPVQQRGVGMVFQHYALFKHMTVAQNIEFGLRIRKVPTHEKIGRCEEMLDLVGLSGLGDRYPNQLSGGQRQRVAVARALAYRPSVLLLDEPFGALDVRVRSQLRESFRDLHQKLGMTTILVTHDQEEAFELADRIGVLERGRLVEVGEPRSLYHLPRTESVASFVGSGNVLVGRVREGSIKLGEVSLNFPEGSPAHDEGSPVRVLFRPEAVTFSSTPIEPLEGIYPLGKGKLTDAVFLGPGDRLSFEVPALHGIRQLAPAVEYGQRNPVIVASRASWKEQGAPLEVGGEYWLGVRHLHVLDPFGLKLLIPLLYDISESPGAKFAIMLARAARGGATLLRVLVEGEQSEVHKELESLQQNVVGTTKLRLDTKLRTGDLAGEILAETQEGFYEVVVLDRTPAIETREDFSILRHGLLRDTNVPVLLVGTPREKLERILICTGGGEPGRSDVRVGGRIARQTGAFVTLFHAFRAGSTQATRDRVMRHMNGAQGLLYSLGIESEIKVCEEPIISAVEREAEQGDYDLVVIGSSTYRAGASGRSSELADDIVRVVSRPLLIVPSTEG